MGYIHIDVDAIISEIDDKDLIDEIKSRAKQQKKSLKRLFADNTIGESVREDVCNLLELNHLASDDDIVSTLLNKIK